MRATKACIAAVFMIVLAGCGTISTQQAILGSVSVKLLDAEFKQASEALRAVPFSASEAMAIDLVIANLDRERIYLRTLHKQGAKNIALTAAQSNGVFSGITQTYVQGRTIYLSYLARSGATPNPFLVSYDKSAQQAYASIKAALEKGEDVSTGVYVEYLGLALRVLAAFKGVPAV